MLEDGDSFGELALIGSGRRAATVVTAMTTHFLSIDKDVYEQSLQSALAALKGRPTPCPAQPCPKRPLCPALVRSSGRPLLGFRLGNGRACWRALWPTHTGRAMVPTF
jgi:CRP-like cAMP-binding protein